MARPQKHNADYFPHGTDLRNDRRSKALRNKYGAEGYGVFNMLLEALAHSDHFEITYNPLEVELLAGDFEVEAEKLSSIIEYLLKLELLEQREAFIFSPVHNELKKLLVESREKERKRKTDGKPIQTEVFHAENPVQNPQGEVLQAENPVFQTENTQSKVNESKEKEKKENIIQGDTAPDFNFCKDFFLKEAKNYYWEKKDDENLSQLLQKLKTIASGEIFSAFKTFIQKLPEYWRSKKFTMQHLNINFNEVTNEIQTKNASIQVKKPVMQPSYTHHTTATHGHSGSKTTELSEDQKQQARAKLINYVCGEYKKFCETGSFNVQPIRLAYNLFVEEKMLMLNEQELKNYEIKAIELRKQELHKPKSREERFKFKNLLESYTNGVNESEKNKIERLKQQLAVLDFLKLCKGKNIDLKILFTENNNRNE